MIDIFVLGSWRQSVCFSILLAPALTGLHGGIEFLWLLELSG